MYLTKIVHNWKRKISKKNLFRNSGSGFSSGFYIFRIFRIFRIRSVYGPFLSKNFWIISNGWFMKGVTPVCCTDDLSLRLNSFPRIPQLLNFWTFNMAGRGKGGKRLGKGLSMNLILQTRHIMAKNTIRNSMYFFAVHFFALV